MSVIRIVHNKENPFVQLNKAALWDDQLSLKAVGLWARCMSRPDNWRFNIKELIKRCKEGRRAIDATIKELIEAGYALRLEYWEKSTDGKFSTGGFEYVFFEFPATQEDKDRVLEEFKKSFQHCSFSNLRNRNRQNSNLLIKTLTQKEEETKKEESPIVPKGDPSVPSKKRTKEEKNEVAFGVWLTNSQRLSLLERLEQNTEKLTACYDKLSVWKIAKGQTRINDYLNIIRWVIRAVEEDASKPQPVNHEEVNRKFMEGILIEIPFTPDICMGNNYVEFNFGPNNRPYIKFTDSGFQEQIINNLRKMGIFPKLEAK